MLRGLALASIMVCELDRTLELGHRILALADSEAEPHLVVEGHYVLGVTTFWRGELAASCDHLEQAIARYRPEDHRAHVSLYAQDPKVVSLCRLALTLWYLGRPSDSARAIEESLTLGDALGHPFSLAYALRFAGWLTCERRDTERTEELARALAALSAERGFTVWQPLTEFLLGWVEARRGRAAAGATRIADGLARLPATGDVLDRTYGLSLLAQAHALAGQPGTAPGVVRGALAETEQTGQRYLEAELHRLHGELLLTEAQGADASEAEEALRRALEVARRQGAKLLELRAAVSLARWRDASGPPEKAAETRRILERIFRGFQEAPDMADLEQGEGATAWANLTRHRLSSGRTFRRTLWERSMQHADSAGQGSSWLSDGDLRRQRSFSHTSNGTSPMASGFHLAIRCPWPGALMTRRSSRREETGMATNVATLTGTQAKVSNETLDELRAQLRGQALMPSDPGYADIRPVYNAMHAGRPALAVGCSGTADVIDAVNFARAHDLLVAIRGGGHSVAGLSTGDGGLLLDLASMRAVQVDPERRLARVQGGALWGDLDRECQAFGLATPGGRVSDTGVAGLTLGGGYGHLQQKYGLSCDNVVQAQVVCADGQVRTASAEVNPDLFWALRGGGGNFGVVTSFTFRLHPLGPIVAFAATFYPLEETAGILRNWRDYVEAAPDEVTSVCITITFPANPAMPEAVHDRPVIIAAGVYAGDADEGMKVMQPLGQLGTPLFDMSQPMPFTAVQAGFDPLFPRDQQQAYWKSQYLNELSDDAIDFIAAKASQRPSDRTMVNIFKMGGAIAEVGPEDTAFAERTAPYMISIDGVWWDAADNANNIAWVRQTWDETSQFGTGAVYLNFTGLSDEAPSTAVDSAFGRNLRRLTEIKATYDPNNFFRLNNNIAPA